MNVDDANRRDKAKLEGVAPPKHVPPRHTPQQLKMIVLSMVFAHTENVSITDTGTGVLDWDAIKSSRLVACTGLCRPLLNRSHNMHGSAIALTQKRKRRAVMQQQACPTTRHTSAPHSASCHVLLGCIHRL